MGGLERSFRVGLPNRGRLGDLCRGIFINNLRVLHESVTDSRRYHHYSKDEKFEFVFARSKDLPKLQRLGIIDVCITGKDYVEDSGEDLMEVLDLDLCPGSVDLLVPFESKIRTPSDLEGLTIATQLPNIARHWLVANNLQTAQLLINEGANEVYPYLGLAHATIDIVSTGDTARINGLISMAHILYSSGRLFSSEDAYFHNRSQIDDLSGMLQERYLKQ